MPINNPWLTGQKPPVGAVIDISHPDCDGLVDAWLFNEQAGQLTRSLFGYSGNGTGLAFAGTAVGPSLDCTGNTAGSTATHYAVVKNPPYLNGAYTATIEARVYITNSPGANACEIYKHDSQIMLRTVNATGIWWDFINWPGVHITRTNGAFTPPVNTWVTVHGIFDGNAGHVWVNGFEATYSLQQTGAGPLPAVTSDVGIGADPSNSEAFSGYIAHILVWRRNLSKVDIARRIAEPYAFVTLGSPFEELFVPPTDTYPAGDGMPTRSQYQQLLAR